MLGIFKTKAIWSRPMLSEAISLKADVELVIIVNILSQSVSHQDELSSFHSQHELPRSRDRFSSVSHADSAPFVQKSELKRPKADVELRVISPTIVRGLA